MMHVAKSIFVACVALAFASRVVPAQQLAPRGVTRSSLQVDTAHGDTAVVTEHSQSYYVFRDAAIGGGVGVVAGVVTAALVLSSSSGTNHSGDQDVYAILTLVCGMVGVVSGAIFGSLTAR